MLRLLAIISNICVLGLIAFMFIQNGPPGPSEAILVIALVVASALSLLALWKQTGPIFGNDNLVALWIKRKKLELSAQIKALGDDV
jgi:hypothetical protein